MKTSRVLGLASLLSGLVIAAACGDEEATVRPRLDGGTLADAQATDGSTCGLVLPGTYDSPTFETTAFRELDLRNRLDQLLAPMANVEGQIDGGVAPTPITKAQLDTLYAAGDPSVRSASTAYYQGRVGAFIDAYAAAITDGAYAMEVPDGGDKGGVFGGYIVDGTGVDLRQAIEKGTYTAAFYNQAVSLAATTPLTVATIDRLLAVYGAHPSFPNNPNAPQNRDVNVAAFAARRDSKDASNPGPYQRIRGALIAARAAVAAGEGCAAERDAALGIFFREWERASFATVVHDLGDIIARLSSGSPDYPAALHAFGEAVGFVAGWKTAPGPRRIVTDAQLDSLLQRIFAADGAPIEAYKLRTSSVEAATRLQQAIGDIKGIYGFTDAEIEAFKKDN